MDLECFKDFRAEVGMFLFGTRKDYFSLQRDNKKGEWEGNGNNEKRTLGRTEVHLERKPGDETTGLQKSLISILKVLTAW